LSENKKEKEKKKKPEDKNYRPKRERAIGKPYITREGRK